MRFLNQLSYRARVRLVILVVGVLVVDAGNFIAEHAAQERDAYEERITELEQEVSNRESELARTRHEYQERLMTIATTVYEREYYSMGGYSTPEGVEVTAVYEAIMNEAQDYHGILQEVGNYFDARKDYIDEIPSVWPVEYNELTSITSGFGYRISPISGEVHYHAGIDIAGVWNAEIIATADGVVLEHWLPPGVHWGVRYDGHEHLGGMVKIEHAGGFVTVYGHMEATFVHEGDRVKRGDPIGIMGNTGTSKGRHLHYEILRDGEPVNPIDYLQF